MGDRRIKVPADKMDIIERLIAGEGTTGPFRLQADVMAFAAALGAARGGFSPFDNSPKEPIREQVFEDHGYGTLLAMLPVLKHRDPSLLASTDEMDERRAALFAAYANAGLELLREELKGAVDDTEAILMLLAKERQEVSGQPEDDFDLRSIVHDD